MNRALHEFGRYGYQKTSAEQVAKSAGISKGMVFHYFGNKLGLYEYLFTYAGNYLINYFGNLEEQTEGVDYLEQYRFVTRIKLRAYQENPNVFAFFSMVFSHPESLKVSAVIKAKYDEVMMLRDKTLVMMQTSASTAHFRKDIDVQMIKKYIAWMIEGYTQSLFAVFKDGGIADKNLDPFWEEFDTILENMKQLFYQS